MCVDVIGARVGELHSSELALCPSWLASLPRASEMPLKFAEVHHVLVLSFFVESSSVPLWTALCEKACTMTEPARETSGIHAKDSRM